jgi:trk system potassium uptake protein TrkH
MAIYFQFFDDTHLQPHSTIAFLDAFLICFSLGFLLYYFGRKASGHLYRREGLIAVVLIWFLTPLIGAIPFYLSGTLENPVQAYFEAASGLSTTGASVMTPKRFNSAGKEVPITKEFCGVHPEIYTYYGTIDPVRDPETGIPIIEGIEAVSKALLFWRSFLQWLGGLGIIVLFVAILPLLGVGGKVLYQAEMPGPIKDSLTPRIKETASLLWKIYLGMSVAEVALLMITNADMTWFDSICITCSTLSTGGFSVKNASIGAYQNAATDWVVLFFMVVASINFSIYFYTLRGKFYKAYEPEFFLYLFMLSATCWFAAWYLVGSDKELLAGPSGGVYSLSEAIRYGFFQIVSAHTSTGFAVANFDLWPYAVQVLMLIIIYVGGMSGSTAGGTKIVRHFMAFRIVLYKIESLFRPETVRTLRVGGRELDQNAVLMVMSFFVIVVGFSIFSIFFYMLDGIGPETSLGLTACMINNSGLAFRAAGPMGTFAFLSNFSMIMSSILMILGRLEFYAVLALFVPAFWRQNR